MLSCYTQEFGVYLIALKTQTDPENAPHVRIVISPLRALMKDQFDRFKGYGIKSAVLTRREEMTDDDRARK